jgi:S-disulfanyl-L-cysteine oxidoreductase SoxD
MRWIGLVLAVVLLSAAASRPVAQAKKTVWDGVYTAQQADRGEQIYKRACSYCHRADLSGGDDGAPALRGAPFVGQWKDRPLSEMFFVLRETMPQEDPGSLKAEEYADIIGFLLESNGARAGDAELPADNETLKGIVFTSRVAE